FFFVSIILSLSLVLNFLSFFFLLCILLLHLHSFPTRRSSDLCRLALLPFLISCLIWLDLVASLPLIKERILVIISGRLATKSNQDRKSGSAGMPRPISYAVFCLKKKKVTIQSSTLMTNITTAD